MARLDTDNWYRIDFKTANFVTECCGFFQKPFDLWDIETKAYFHQDSDLSFNFKIAQTDDIGFLIQPFFEDRPITLERFKEELVKMGKLKNEESGKVALT